MDKQTKQQAGRAGGLSTLARHGHDHFAQIGRKGAAVTWSRYALRPVGTSELAMCKRDTGEVVAFISGGKPG